MDGDFLEAVKRHILSRLQMRGRPNITHAVPKAAMVTALRKLHAGKVREDGRVEIPHLDGHASPGADGQERVSEIISFAETGGSVPRAAGWGPRSLPQPLLLAHSGRRSPRALADTDSRLGSSLLALCAPSRPRSSYPAQHTPSFLLLQPQKAFPSNPIPQNPASAPLGARPPPGGCVRPWLRGHLLGDCLMFLFPTIRVCA